MLLEHNLSNCPLCGCKAEVHQWYTSINNKRTESFSIECPRCNKGTLGLKTVEEVQRYWEEDFIPRRLLEQELMKKGSKKKKKVKKAKESEELNPSLKRIRTEFNVEVEPANNDFEDTEDTEEAFYEDFNEE